MAYSADDTLSLDATFRGKMRMAAVNAARQIASEARTVRNVVDQKRNSLAVAVLNDPPKYLDRFVHAAIEAGALTLASTDAQIDTALAAVWNFLAGVTPQDLA